MKKARFGICTAAVAVGVLASACGGSRPISAIASGAVQSLHGVQAPDSARRGVYAGEFLYSGIDVFGFANNNRENGAAICDESLTYASGIAVDGKGNLIVPQYSAGISVFKGPQMCGPKLGSFQTISGDGALNAASADAANGTIAIAAYQDAGSGAGSIELCTLKAGCRTNLTGGMNEVLAVAMSNAGDCWASSAADTALTYFKGCAEPAQNATGYLNPSAGGLDIDNHGNLVAISDASPDEHGVSLQSSSEVYVYSGCNPKCTLVGGPFALEGGSLYGHLNKENTRFVAADHEYGQVDIYKYTPTAIRYLYSFNNGLSTSIIGAAYNPRSKQ